MYVGPRKLQCRPVYSTCPIIHESCSVVLSTCCFVLLLGRTHRGHRVFKSSLLAGAPKFYSLLLRNVVFCFLVCLGKRDPG